MAALPFSTHHPEYCLPGQMQERVQRSWHGWFLWMRLEVAHSTSIHFPLEETRSRGHTPNCKGAGNLRNTLYQWPNKGDMIVVDYVWKAPALTGDVAQRTAACLKGYYLPGSVLGSPLFCRISVRFMHNELLGLTQKMFGFGPIWNVTAKFSRVLFLFNQVVVSFPPTCFPKHTLYLQKQTP